VAIGCAGTRTFHEVARAGDTVALGAGWNHNFTPDNLTVTITPFGSAPIVYTAGDPVGPGDPAIRAVTNMYVDPLSSLVISRQTNQDLTPFAGSTYAWSIDNNFTAGDKDWWQTVVFIDLPQTLPDLSPYPTGTTTIVIDGGGETATSSVEIVGAGGTASTFSASGPGPLNATQLDALRRVDHFTVDFSGTTVPHAIQIDLIHDPDADNGGAGYAYVVNPIGYIKNATWSDDGANLRVILTPTRDAEITSLTDFKFYVAGGVTGLQFPLGGTTGIVQAFDSNGNPVADITATVD